MKLLTKHNSEKSYQVLDGGKYNGNSGFDHVLQDKNGEVIIIVDSKQISKQGSMQLSGSGAQDALKNPTNQLSTNWINAVVSNLKDEQLKTTISQKLKENKVKTAVVGVDKTNGKIVLVPVEIPNK